MERACLAISPVIKARPFFHLPHFTPRGIASSRNPHPENFLSFPPTPTSDHHEHRQLSISPLELISPCCCCSKSARRISRAEPGEGPLALDWNQESSICDTLNSTLDISNLFNSPYPPFNSSPTSISRVSGTHVSSLIPHCRLYDHSIIAPNTVILKKKARDIRSRSPTAIHPIKPSTICIPNTQSARDTLKPFEQATSASRVRSINIQCWQTAETLDCKESSPRLHCNSADPSPS